MKAKILPRTSNGVKKLIISLSIIGVVAAIAIGGTIAYFSDTETSSGNTFTAGDLDLTIDSQCKYNGVEQASCTWLQPKDLISELFFNFNDIKPGDDGEDTVSLHVNNDSWACLKLANIASQDNSCTQPEIEAEPNCGQDNNGELLANLKIKTWRDLDCDNAYEPADGETLIEAVSSEADIVYPIADKNHGTKLLASTPKTCVGIMWNVPVTTGNEIQSDSLRANVVFYAEQWRNNLDFECVESITECVPTAEICDGQDNDCDDVIDEDCVEICGDDIDNDRDGEIDEGCTPWVNEIHYDNTGTDTNEGVEIAGKAGIDLTGWTVIFYNGANGESYNTLLLSGTIPNQQGGLGTLWIALPTDGLQNGSPDGLALVSPTGVIQFLSYEGSFMATNGPAIGMTSVDIGIAESGTTPVGYSLQLQGTGNEYSDFIWTGPIGNTRGARNISQTFN